MKGYKGMEMDMSCRGMQYELGKSYHIDNPVMCAWGFHFCKNLEETFKFYDWKNSRFFEVEATGEIICDDYSEKMVTSDIKIVREIDKSVISRIVYSFGSPYGLGSGFTSANGYAGDYFYDYIDGNGFGYGHYCSKCNGLDYDYGDAHGNGCNIGNSFGYGNDCGDGWGCGFGYTYTNGDGYGEGYSDGNTNSILKILNFK